MNSVASQITPADYYDLSELVAKDLRNSCSKEEIHYLQDNKDIWRRELLSLKRKTESQFTSSKSRRFEWFCNLQNGTVTMLQYHTFLIEEKKWLCNATKFLAIIEDKLASLKA